MTKIILDQLDQFMRLSLCIATYNEEQNIHYPLDSAYSLVDEVVLVDGGSTDKTVEKAKSYGKKVRVFSEDNPSMFHINKQKAIERARGEWILQLDADESLSPELKEEIKTLLNPKSETRNPFTVNPFRMNPKQYQNSYDKNSKHFDHSDFENSNLFRASNFDIRNYVAYYLPRKNFFLNRFLTKGGQYPDYTIRLYRNGFARFPCKDVHENVEIINPKSKIQISNQIQNPNDKISNNNLTMKQFNNETVGYLKYPVLHYADPTFPRFLKRWDRSTSLEANKLLQEVKSQKSKVKSLTMFIDYF